MMLRREVLEWTGYLDEGYFLYFEEVDLCARAAQAGWTAWCVPASRVLHLEGQATGITQLQRRRGRYWFDSRRRFLVKRHGLTGLIIADTLWALGRLSLRARQTLQLASTLTKDPEGYAFDLLWGDIRAFFTGEAWSIRRRMRV